MSTAFWSHRVQELEAECARLRAEVDAGRHWLEARAVLLQELAEARTDAEAYKQSYYTAHQTLCQLQKGLAEVRAWNTMTFGTSHPEIYKTPEDDDGV